MNQIFVTGLFTLLGVILGSYISYKLSRNQSILEAKRIIYAKLLSNMASEESYPEIRGTVDTYNETKVEEYNKKLSNWRKNRLLIKGIATEALFVTNNKELSNILNDFIYSKNPDNSLLSERVRDLMRKEIEM